MCTRKNILFILIVLMLCPLMSCINVKQPNPGIKYYTLEYDSPKFSEKPPLPFVIKLDNFKVAPVYNTTGIIYREQAFERKIYSYHRWMVNPGEMVSYFIGRDLRESGLFKGILLRGERGQDVSYRLTGMLEEFYELDDNKAWQGVITLSISLAPQGGLNSPETAIFQKTYSAKELCSMKNPASLAEALSIAMEKVSREIMEDIYDYLKKEAEK